MAVRLSVRLAHVIARSAETSTDLAFRSCGVRFIKVRREDKVYCPEGTVHLVN
jgi:hypothetical protein